MYAEEYQRQAAGLPVVAVREAQRQLTSSIRRGFSNIQFTVEDRFADGDKLCVLWTARGTHQGEYMGILATGKAVEASGISVHCFEGGKIRESWDAVDNLGMMQQLGLVPAAGQSSLVHDSDQATEKCSVHRVMSGPEHRPLTGRVALMNLVAQYAPP